MKHWWVSASRRVGLVGYVSHSQRRTKKFILSVCLEIKLNETTDAFVSSCFFFRTTLFSKKLDLLLVKTKNQALVLVFEFAQNVNQGLFWGECPLWKCGKCWLSYDAFVNQGTLLSFFWACFLDSDVCNLVIVHQSDILFLFIGQPPTRHSIHLYRDNWTLASGGTRKTKLHAKSHRKCKNLKLCQRCQRRRQPHTSHKTCRHLIVYMSFFYLLCFVSFFFFSMHTSDCQQYHVFF